MMKLGGKSALVRSAAYVAVVLAAFLLARRWLALPKTGDWRKDWAAARERQRIPLARRMVADGVLIGHSFDECLQVFGPGVFVWEWTSPKMDVFSCAATDQAGKVVGGHWFADGPGFGPKLLNTAGTPPSKASVERLPDWVRAWKDATPEERVEIAKSWVGQNPLQGHSLSECIELLGIAHQASWPLVNPKGPGSVAESYLVIRFDDQRGVISADVPRSQYKPTLLRRLLGY